MMTGVPDFGALQNPASVSPSFVRISTEDRAGELALIAAAPLGSDHRGKSR